MLCDPSIVLFLPAFIVIIKDWEQPKWPPAGTWLSFPDGSVVKNLPPSAGDTEPWVQSLGQADPLEEEMATHSSILAWRIPRTEEPGRITLCRVTESDTTEAT